MQQIKVINEQGIFQPPHDFEHLRKCADKYHAQVINFRGFLSSEIHTYQHQGHDDAACQAVIGIYRRTQDLPPFPQE